MLKFVTALVISIGCLSGLSAQFNVYAGYRLGFTDPENFNAIVEAHNQVIADDRIVNYRDGDGFSDLSYLNGFDLGLSYGFPGGRVQMGWMSKRKQIRADGERISNSNRFENRITTTINELGIGYYPTFGKFYIGGTLEYNFLKIKADFEERGDPEVILNPESFSYSNAWSSHFSVGFDLSNGGLIGLKIEPYIQLYWSDYDLSGFYKNITGDLEGTIPLDTDETFATFGIAFIVYNGPQRR